MERVYLVRNASAPELAEEEEMVAIPLTAQDVAILRLLMGGLSDREIGDRLRLSAHTIDRHLDKLRARTGTTNRVTLAVWATRRAVDKLETALLAPPRDE